MAEQGEPGTEASTTPEPRVFKTLAGKFPVFYSPITCYILFVGWTVYLFFILGIDLTLALQCYLPFALFLLLLPQVVKHKMSFIIDFKGVGFQGGRQRILWNEMTKIRSPGVSGNWHGAGDRHDIVIQGEGEEIQLTPDLFPEKAGMREIFRELARRARDHPHILVEDDYGWLDR